MSDNFDTSTFLISTRPKIDTLCISLTYYGPDEIEFIEISYREEKIKLRSEDLFKFIKKEFIVL